MWAAEEEEGKNGARNELERQERILVESNRLQVVVEAHEFTQHNGAKRASYLLTEYTYDCAIEVPLEPLPTPLTTQPQPPNLRVTHVHNLHPLLSVNPYDSIVNISFIDG